MWFHQIIYAVPARKSRLKVHHFVYLLISAFSVSYYSSLIHGMWKIWFHICLQLLTQRSIHWHWKHSSDIVFVPLPLMPQFMFRGPLSGSSHTFALEGGGTFGHCEVGSGALFQPRFRRIPRVLDWIEIVGVLRPVQSTGLLFMFPKPYLKYIRGLEGHLVCSHI